MGFAVRELTPRGSIRIRIRWGRVAVLLVLLGMVAWVGKSAALLYFFRKVRNFEAVTFKDAVLFPLNRANLRLEQGNYQIEQGRRALEREDFLRAFNLLREGVARAPGNVEGRMLLAQIYASWRPDLAADLLLDGIRYGSGNPQYVKTLLMLLLAQKRDTEILELTERLLAQQPPEEVRHLLTVARLQAAMYNGKYEIARELFDTTDLAQTMDGIILGTQLYMRRGNVEKATEVLNAIIRSHPDAKIDPVFSQLAGIYKSQGLFDRGRETALELVIRNPLDWQPRILLVDMLSSSGLVERRDREIEALLQQHRNDEQAMMALAQLAANYGNVRAALRLYEIALENGYSLSLFSLSLAEALVKGGESQRAIELCNELVREDPPWLAAAESSFNAIRSLAYYTFGDAELGRLYLRNFLNSPRTSVNQLYQAARSFNDQGLPRQALQILEEAYKREPRNEAVLALMIDVEMATGGYFAIDRHLRELFNLRRPDYQLLESIHQRLQSDRFLFTPDRTGLLERLEAILAEREQMNWDIWERRAPGA